MESARTWLAAACAALAGVARPLDRLDLERLTADVPRMESATAQLRHATRASTALRRCAPDHRLVERRRVALAYLAVRARFPEELALVAEASFRAAELWRICGDLDTAAAELEVVRRLPCESEFRERATLELAHLERRRERFERALDLYALVASDDDCEVRRRDEAALWLGKTHALAGRADEAARWLRRLAHAAAHPLDRIRAYDEWAVLYVDEGDVEAAAGVLHACRTALAEPAREATRLGDGVRDALAHMRCIALLERAIARRRKGLVLHGDGDDDGADE
jgi:tetratricopeptide (TPR) repeat protein